MQFVKKRKVYTVLLLFKRYRTKGLGAWICPISRAHAFFSEETCGVPTLGNSGGKVSSDVSQYM